MPGQPAAPPPVALPSETPAVSWGPTSTLGVALTIVGALGSIAAAVKANDTATITAGIATVLAALTTLGGRMAQAVALARSTAVASAPLVDALQDALASTPPGVVPVLPPTEPGETVNVSIERKAAP